MKRPAASVNVARDERAVVDTPIGVRETAAIVSRLLPRSLCSIVVLVAALAQLVAANELVFAGTLPLVSRSHGHGHPVTLQAHEGHVDVVLHHEGEAPAASASLDAEPVHGDDHVLHVASAEISAKRSQEAPPAAGALMRGHAPDAAPMAVASAAGAPTHGSRSLPDGLRTTVLRL